MISWAMGFRRMTKEIKCHSHLTVSKTFTCLITDDVDLDPLAGWGFARLMVKLSFSFLYVPFGSKSLCIHTAQWELCPTSRRVYPDIISIRSKGTMVLGLLTRQPFLL
jgi:hypothetical protein